MSAVLVAEVAVPSGNVLGESIVWDDRTGELVWVDIERGRLERSGGASGRRTTRLRERIGAVGLRASEGFVAAFASRLALLDGAGQEIRNLAPVEDDLGSTRLNDGRVDRQGRFVCGGMDEGPDARPISAVHRLDADGTVHKVIDGVSCANSIAFSPDGSSMYFADTPTGRILVYEYDTDAGIPHSPRLFADGSEHPGLPDGSAVDAEGCLWNARWGGGSVVRYTPDGKVDRVVRVSAANPTCVAFGGDDLSTLYITTARIGRTAAQLAEEPHAGAVFAVEPGVGGLVEARYAG